MDKQNPRRPVYDERDREIDILSKGKALDLLAGCAELFTILCILKGNPAWMGGLALLLLGMAAGCWYRGEQYEERPVRYVALLLGAAAVGLLLWFAFGGQGVA